MSTFTKLILTAVHVTGGSLHQEFMHSLPTNHHY